MNGKDRSRSKKGRTAALVAFLSLLCLHAGGAAPTGAISDGGGRFPSAEAGLSLRRNLLRLATLTPDVGGEWRFGGGWSVLVDGSWTSWSWSGKERRHALWEVSPQVRRRLGSGRRGYVGAMFKAGSFNHKPGRIGRQGDIIGGGIVCGRELSLGKSLALDFSLGLGCLSTDYEKYEVVRGVRVYRADGGGLWWGPVSAGVTLVWAVF